MKRITILTVIFTILLIGTMQAVLFAGKGTTLVGSTPIVVVINAPLQNEVWSGPQTIQYWHDRMGNVPPGFADITCNGQILYDSAGSSSENLAADGFFEWDTTTFSNTYGDAANAIIEVTVHHAGDTGIGQSGPFVVVNNDITPPTITITKPLNGAQSSDMWQPFHADVSDNLWLKQVVLWLDPVNPQGPPDGTEIYNEFIYSQTAAIDFSPSSLLSDGSHVYRLLAVDIAGNEYFDESSFTILRAPQNVSKSIHLNFNQIGFSVMPEGLPSPYMASDLANDMASQGITVTTVQQWSDGWVTYTHLPDPLPFTDFSLDLDGAILVHALSQGTWTITGLPIFLPKDIFLLSGWNLIAIPTTIGVNTYIEMLQQINSQGGNVDLATWWDDGWNPTNVGLPFTDQNIDKQNRGIFIRSYSNSTWSIQP